GDGTIVDYTDVAIVGDYIGAQMAAIAAEAKVGLIDHLQDAEVGAPYPDRRVVVAGNSPFTSSSSGALPDGMSFDPTSGVLSGTPNETGEFQFSITAEDHVAPPTTKSYILRVAEAGVELPPAYVLATSSEPDVAGTTSGDGSYGVDSNATLTSTAVEGYAFVNWTENGTLVSTNETEMVLMNVNHTLVAHFVSTNAQYAIGATSSPTQGGTITGEGTYSDGTSVTLTATPTQGFLFANWTENGAVVSADAGYTFTATAARDLVANFTIDSSQVGQWIITTGSSPLAGGSTAGGGVFNNGANVTVSATANAGYMFKRWTESNNNVSSSANYLFSATNNRSLIAKFALAYTVTTSSDPTTGGTTDGAGLFEDGDSVNLNATANQGYRFANWIENGTNVSSSASYRLKANPDRSFTARFSLIIPGSDIVPATNGDRVIEWPSATQLPGWTVQSSTNLSDWVACESEVEDDGVTKQIHMRMDTAKRFYRMIHE
ncbi:MAG: hypothetical protein RIR25_2071, partial [Verrucomicrobiota bacterium]